MNPSANDKNVVLRVSSISKEFPGVKALTNVSMEIHRGEVLALLGENGAGKSTLMKILSCVYSLDSGEMELGGQKVRFTVPSEAKEAGIGIIHQELNYVSTISVAENIYMGAIPKKHGLVDYKAMYAGARAIMSRIGVTIDPRILIGQCTVAQKQLIEIAKVIANDIKVLIMDEPTSALNDVETESLFRFVRQASSEGLAIIYISHKLDEIFKLADRVVVLRDGQVTGELPVKGATRESLITMMAGRKIDEQMHKSIQDKKVVVLEVKGLSNARIKNISFEARRSEVLGIYGLLGSGHLDIGPALFGYDLIDRGDIIVDGKRRHINAPLDAVHAGIAYVPSERKTEGLVLNSSVQTNIMAPYYASGGYQRLMSKRLEGDVANKWIRNLKIKTPSKDTRVESLSGGNQQKLVLSKWLELEPEVLILNEPTRGIDVGAKVEIYRILNTLCENGKCIIMVTSEMPELLSMSDRIMVMCDGEISGMLDRENVTQEDIIKLAIGG